MSDAVKVSKIVVKMGKKEVELSLEEAKELQELLNNTFGKKETVYVPGSPIVVPYPVQVRPNYYRHWEITWCNSNTVSSDGTLTYSLTNNTELEQLTNS